MSDSFGFFDENISEGVSITPQKVIKFPSAGNLAGLGPKVAKSVNPGNLGIGSVALNPLNSAVILKGSSNVYINGRQAGRIGDPVNRLDRVVRGSGSVFINNIPATRRKDKTMLRRNVVTDANNVYIGD